ncbi:MAG: protein translocase subunit SecF [Rhodobacteraceae bacterium]|nr:protein translocase subunit SecF [Paracoccaceae bacterium]MCY4198089.1 protein translocase subunit SecF [Paracoccaceae bacterium]
MRLKLVPEQTSWDFMRHSQRAIYASGILSVVSLLLVIWVGLNFGIDFRGGTTIRSVSQTPVDIGEYRNRIAPLELGDVVISEVFDISFGPDENVASIRFEAQGDEEAVSSLTVVRIQEALRALDPEMQFPLVESVGPKVSGELIQKAVLAVLAAIGAVLLYIWLRFEWQFSLGAVTALVHDVVLTLGIFSALQIKFDLAIIAALLTIVGYSLNDTVVLFDRVRENLRRYKKPELSEVLNLSVNGTLSRTVMTSVTTLIALIALFVFGGDVIRPFVFAMIWGVVVGTYSSIFVASNILLRLGVKRDWEQTQKGAGTKFTQDD